METLWDKASLAVWLQICLRCAYSGSKEPKEEEGRGRADPYCLGCSWLLKDQLIFPNHD